VRAGAGFIVPLTKPAAAPVGDGDGAQGHKCSEETRRGAGRPRLGLVLVAWPR
jgi:hypothetical protein